MSCLPQVRLKSYIRWFLSKRVKPSGSTKKSMQETPPSPGGVLEDMAGSKLHPSLLPNHRSSREDKSEWARSVRVWSSILSHRLMQKRSDLSGEFGTLQYQWTYRSQSFIQFLSKDRSRKSRTLSVGKNSSGATFKSEGRFHLFKKEGDNETSKIRKRKLTLPSFSLNSFFFRTSQARLFIPQWGLFGMPWIRPAFYFVLIPANALQKIHEALRRAWSSLSLL